MEINLLLMFLSDPTGAPEVGEIATFLSAKGFPTSFVIACIYLHINNT